MIKALIFDFDGVIGDTYEMNFNLSKLFDPNITRQDFEDHHNGNVWSEPKIKISREEVKILFHKQREIFTENHIFEVARLFEELASKYSIFVISSSSEENIWHYLRLGQIDKYVEKVLGLETHTSKVEKFKILFEEYKISNNDCLFVTDTIGDIKEGRHIGVKSIAVTWGYHPKVLLESEKPHKIIDTPERLIDTIREIENEHK